MNLRSQKRIASELLGVGINRIKIDPDAIEDISKAITRDDIRFFIANKLITVEQKKGISRGRVRKKKLQKKKGFLGRGF